MRNHLQPLIAAAFFAGFVSAVAPLVFAKGNQLDTGTRRIPYSGTLERNGAGYTGQVDLRFTLTGAGATNSDGGACSHVETFGDQNVYAGKFSVQLGSNTTLPDCVWNATSMTVAVAVRDGTSTGNYTALTGSQTIRPVPFAYWAAEGSNFTVDGTVSAGTVNSTGDTYVGSFLYVKGSDIVLGTSDGRTTNSTNGTALAHIGSDVLHLNYNNSFEGGVQIGNGSTSTSIPGSLTVSGTTNLVQAAFTNTASADYNAAGWLTSNSQIKLRLWTDSTTPTLSYGLGIQSNTLFFNTKSDYIFYAQGVPRLTIGSTAATLTTNLSVSGTVTATTLVGRFTVETKSAGLTAGVDTTITCDSDEMPLSWGMSKNDSGDEDMISGRLDFGARACIFHVDESGGADGAKTGYCYCMKAQ